MDSPTRPSTQYFLYYSLSHIVNCNTWCVCVTQCQTIYPAAFKSTDVLALSYVSRSTAIIFIRLFFVAPVASLVLSTFFFAFFSLLKIHLLASLFVYSSTSTPFFPPFLALLPFIELFYPVSTLTITFSIP